MVVTLDELELLRAKCRNGRTRDDEVTAHLADVEIRRRKKAGAKPKPQLLTLKERNRISARDYRKRKKEKADFARALKADRKRARKRLEDRETREQLELRTM